MSDYIIEVLETPETELIITEVPPESVEVFTTVLSGPAGSPGANGVGVIPGGTTNQVLAKNSNTDYDMKWVNSGGGGGGAVDSVNGQTGVVVLDASDFGLENVDNTSDLDKPISDDTQDALDLKYDASNPSGFINSGQAPIQSVAGKTGSVSLVKSDVGLGSVDNTADSAKPVSTAQAAADAAVQAYSIQRANHTGTQDLSTISQSGATTNQVPTWSGSAWVPQTPSGGGSGLTEAQVRARSFFRC